jgi:Trk K+ transport system NAD-binding subunit
MISETLNAFISNKSNQLIYTNTDNHTEIRVLSVGNNSSLIGKTINDLDLDNETQVIAIISSSGLISHNFSNTLNPLDKILIQSTINYKNND